MYDNNQNNGDRLVESIRQGDIGAYEMLFKKYYLSMCMIARRIVEESCRHTHSVTQRLCIFSNPA